jgi:hypothetical protein
MDQNNHENWQQALSWQWSDEGGLDDRALSPKI